MSVRHRDDLKAPQSPNRPLAFQNLPWRLLGEEERGFVLLLLDRGDLVIYRRSSSRKMQQSKTAWEFNQWYGHAGSSFYSKIENNGSIYEEPLVGLRQIILEEGGGFNPDPTFYFSDSMLRNKSAVLFLSPKATKLPWDQMQRLELQFKYL
jgi:hypothetical protein